MQAYYALTGRNGNLQGFWKLSPAELIAWCEAAMDEEDPYEDIVLGEEVYE